MGLSPRVRRYVRDDVRHTFFPTSMMTIMIWSVVKQRFNNHWILFKKQKDRNNRKKRRGMLRSAWSTKYEIKSTWKVFTIKTLTTHILKDSWSIENFNFVTCFLEMASADDDISIYIETCTFLDVSFEILLPSIVDDFIDDQFRTRRVSQKYRVDIEFQIVHDDTSFDLQASRNLCRQLLNHIWSLWARRTMSFKIKEKWSVLNLHVCDFKREDRSNPDDTNVQTEDVDL